MSNTTTFYDSIIEQLTVQDKIDAQPLYAKVQVEHEQVDAARANITEAGGVITGINSHEAGVTISFEANDFSSDE
jgi:hypothetical protein